MVDHGIQGFSNGEFTVSNKADNGTVLCRAGGFRIKPFKIKPMDGLANDDEVEKIAWEICLSRWLLGVVDIVQLYGVIQLRLTDIRSIYSIKNRGEFDGYLPIARTTVPSVAGVG